MAKKERTKTESVRAGVDEQEVRAEVAFDLGVSVEDVQVEGDVIVLTGDAAEEAAEQGWVEGEPEEVDETNGGETEPESPEFGAPLLALSTYAQLKNLNAFRQGRITALVGKTPRTESAWTRDITAVGG